MGKEIVKEVVADPGKYYAHVYGSEEGNRQRETLLEHTALTENYFNRLWEEKLGDEMLLRMQKQFGSEISKEAEVFWKQLIYNVPVFHDLGKINPAFQNDKMKNRKIQDNGKLSSLVSSRHSLVSALLYLDFFLKKLKMSVKDRKEKKFLRCFILLHSYVIAQHHSDLKKINDYLELLDKGIGCRVIDALRDGECIGWKQEISLSEGGIRDLIRNWGDFTDSLDREAGIALYAYGKLIFSFLTSADYYATSEFMCGAEIKQFGELNEIESWLEIYEETKLMKSIRAYQKEKYPCGADILRNVKDINVLRTEMLCDAEKMLDENSERSVFYLEAPTGSGKSNTAMDLSFQFLKKDRRLRKIYYIYPFNTLVEQNLQSLRKVFGKNDKIFQSIAVVNSLTPVKMTDREKEEEEKTEQTMYYQKALLDRQFLNYPMIVSTHVSLFDTMFGDTKESAFGFHQLMNSVIVLDEIQSYKNSLWGEIICFLKVFAELLNIKVIIMSATLPDLDVLTGNIYPAVKLMKNREKYFSNACFHDRVRISYELLGAEEIEDKLVEHMKPFIAERKKILIEFIKKDSAYRFYRKLAEDASISCCVEYMSGDDSIIERSRILKKIKKEDAVILVATQVIEAGVDIDMDIGYKNISKLDSEEQFMGRINRSCLRRGVVYFFKLDDGKSIYKGDVRIEKSLTLENEDIRKILISKDFRTYYEKVMEVLKKSFYENTGEIGLKDFFANKVGKLDWLEVKDRMKLIEDDNWSMSVFLARVLEDAEGNLIDGRQVWKDYVELLNDFTMDYAEKKVRLSEVTSRMNYFIYQIKKNYDLAYNDKIGEIFYIEDAEKYFEDEKLDRGKIQGELEGFVDFI
jgi:CRISPR-associated endonuclease/helicase Cas3